MSEKPPLILSLRNMISFLPLMQIRQGFWFYLNITTVQCWPYFVKIKVWDVPRHDLLKRLNIQFWGRLLGTKKSLSVVGLTEWCYLFFISTETKKSLDFSNIEHFGNCRNNSCDRRRSIDSEEHCRSSLNFLWHRIRYMASQFPCCCYTKSERSVSNFFPLPYLIFMMSITCFYWNSMRNRIVSMHNSICIWHQSFVSSRKIHVSNSQFPERNHLYLAGLIKSHLRDVCCAHSRKWSTHRRPSDPEFIRRISIFRW